MEHVNDISFPNLGLYFSKLPDGFTVFGREIKFYAVIIAVAFIIAVILAVKEAEKTKQDPDLYLDAFLVTMIPAILGARIYYVIFQWDYYKDNLKHVIYIWEGGLAIYGGVLVGVLTLFLFSRVRKCSFGLLLDTLVPGLVLGQALGRWGNFFNREAFGGNSDSLFAMRIPVDSIHTEYSSAVKIIAGKNGIDYVQVQPTFLFESMLCLLIFILLLVLRRKKKVNGEVFLLYAFLYGAGRFVIEGMRTDQLVLCKIGSVSVPVSQVVAILFIVVSVVLFVVGRQKSSNLLYMEPKAALEEDTEKEEVK